MRVIGPYRLLRTLGAGEAGEVWSAFTADGTSVTVATIDPTRAGDVSWLRRFQAGTDELVRDGLLSVVDADLSPPTPWVACAWDGDLGAARLFTAQGMSYVPAGATAAPAQPARPAEPARPADQPRPPDQPRPIDQPRPTDQPRPPEPPRVAEPARAPVIPAASAVEPPATPAASAVEPPATPALPAAEAPPAPSAVPAAEARPDTPPMPAVEARPDVAIVTPVPESPVPESPVPESPVPESPVPESPVAGSTVADQLAAALAGPAEPSTVDFPTAAPPPVVGRATVVAPQPSTVEPPVVGRAAVPPRPVGRAPVVPPVLPTVESQLPPPPVLEPATLDTRTPSPAQPWAYGRGRAIADPAILADIQRRSAAAAAPGAAPAGPVPTPFRGASPARPAPGKRTTTTPPARQRGRRRSRGLAILLALFILMALAATAGIVLVRLREGATVLPDPSAAGTTTNPSVPTVPRGQGVEPPAEGDWPASWPTFQADERTKPMADLPGFGFTFRVPEAWNCTNRPGASTGQYFCGTSGGSSEVGGDVIVRECPDPCDNDRRVRMREQEDAWGLRWVRGGGFVTWAEITTLPEPSGYGLVVVAYWRSVAEGATDRQIVVRLTAPLDRASEVQKVANEIITAVG